MASGQAVAPEEPLLRKMRGRPVITEGTRNDDCVNLAIIAWVKEGPANGPQNLRVKIHRVIEDYLLDGTEIDEDYLIDKCHVLMDYLPNWEEHDIWEYAIV